MRARRLIVYGARCYLVPRVIGSLTASTMSVRAASEIEGSARKVGGRDERRSRLRE